MLDQLTGCGITAGTALPSIISIHSAASEVSITDHPSSPALATGAIQANVEASLELVRRRGLNPQISINAHEWGSVTDAFAQERHNHYTKVIAADCLWMPHQHRNLINSIAHFLSRACGACALVVAGFHTGRDIVADFFRHFSVANGKDDITTELCIAEIYESDMRGARRIWQEERTNETKEETKRWCVVARIVKSG
jgi:EEF1A N-terminal glycine/lysine methyltransferase